MGYLATVFPSLASRKLPVSRDQTMLLLAAFNEVMLGVDTYLSHVLNQTIRAREWIPIVFGPVAGILLLIAGLIALRRRRLAITLATLVFVVSIVVGVLGAYFHLIRGILPSAPTGERVTLALLVWAPPVLAPFAFAGVGVLGLSAAWQETEPGNGVLRIGRNRHLRLPYSKTSAYFFLVSLGILVSVVSSAWDHVRTGFENPWLWLPLVVGVFATFVAFGAGTATSRLTRADVWTYLVSMVLLIIVGLLGAYFHVRADLTAMAVIVPERFLRGAPFLSPLLFTNMGLVGLAVLMPPGE
jgi:hypothetical protein